MPKTELVSTAIDGKLQEAEVPVMRRIRIMADCQCWNHRPVEFELIVTPRSSQHEHGQVFVRSAIAAHHFRASDRNGPIDVRIESVIQE